jgi:hypothetical protein
MKGSINNALIFNRALTQSEITQIYNAGKDAYTPVTDGLVAQYSGRDYLGTAAAPTIIYDTHEYNKSMDEFIEHNIKSNRVTANDYIGLINLGNTGKLFSVNIEEAP